MANINKIKLSGTTYNIQDLSATKSVELTQAQYDALVSGGTVDPNTFYIITDAQGADLSQYYTSAQTESAITAAVSGKVDTSTFNTYSGSVDTALSGKQETLVSGTNIKTINNESLLGSGNITIQGGGGTSYSAGTGIDITNDVISVTGMVDTTTFNTYSGSVDTALSGKQDTLSAGTGIEISGNVISATGGGGGGKAISAGTNISVTTGETADTINCIIPYSDVIYAKSDIILGKNMPSVSDYERVFYGKKIASRANDAFGYSIGIGVTPSLYNSSDYNELYGSQSIGIGGFKIGNGSQYADFVSGCVAIGYGAKTRINDAVAIGRNTEASGTTKTNINNQLKIDTSNQVYIYNKDNTEMICLQDQLGGGGASYSAGTGIDITNDVISVSGVVMSSAVTSAVTSGSTNVVTSGGVYDQLGGLKLVKLTQSAYDALSPDYDSNTLYIIKD